jgi:adenosylcobyric acid synthase
VLGETLHDDGAGERDGSGLGLLPLATVFAREKLTRRTEVRFAGELGQAWAPLAGRTVRGYEIRHGRTAATGPLSEALAGDRGWVRGPLLAVSVHGLLEDPEILEALFGARPRHTLEQVLDELTDAVVEGLDIARIEELALASDRTI